MTDFVIKGDLLFATNKDELQINENSYLVITAGKFAGIFEYLPEKFRALTLNDFSGKLVIPAFYDLHLHAPQYAQLGLGMDETLLDWLKNIPIKPKAAS